MFTLKYEDWKTVCIQTFQQRRGRQKIYLQWYPFFKLSNKDKSLIASELFFNEFIKNGLFLYYPETWFISNNYILKGDGNFRNASLASPLFYLLFLAIGKNISTFFQHRRPDDISIFYAGNFTQDSFYYEKEYDLFFKVVNHLSQHFTYFLKTDIKDFYANIDITKLFDMINKRVNESKIQLTQKELMVYKEIALFLGQGEFPLMENSVTSSYLSTIIYLEIPDIKLHWYLKNKETDVIDFTMVRYVDDLYILFNSNTPYDKLTPGANRIINYYSSELKKLNLSLNRNKTALKKTPEINTELKKSFYGGNYKNKKFMVTDLIDVNILTGLTEKLEIALNDCILDTKKYSEIIDSVFFIENVEYTPEELFNALLYQENSLLMNELIVEKLSSLISNDYCFLKLDPKRLVLMILNTRNLSLIKLLLNKLFEAEKRGTWDVYDTALAVNYFIQRGFQHNDLLGIIKKEERHIFSYYEMFCKKSFLLSYNLASVNYIRLFHNKLLFKKDEKLFFLYFMCKIEFFRRNYLPAFAYFKSFFDRISAHFAFYRLGERTKNRPNYKKYYKEDALKKLYSGVNNADAVIKNAHRIRNSSPMSHSSSELLDNNNTDKEILQSIKEMTKLISAMILMQDKYSNEPPQSLRKENQCLTPSTEK